MTALAYFILLAEFLFACFLLYSDGLLTVKSSSFMLVFALLMGFGARLLCLEHRSMDYLMFLSGWMSEIHAGGGFSSLSGQIGNYNIPYMTLLSLFSYCRTGDLYLIKLLSIFFDVLLAWAAMKICGLFFNNPRRCGVVFCLVFMLPTVIINSAYWGQCDSLYVSLALLGVYFALADRPVLSVISIAVSFCFKLQAVFIIPVFALFLIKGKLRLKHLLIFPLVCAVLILPAVFAGRPFGDALLSYISQTGSIGNGYSYGAPSFLSLIQSAQTVLSQLNTEETIALVSRIFVVVGFVFVAVVLCFCFFSRGRIGNYEMLLNFALFVLCIPYLLPHMHERYFYCADIAAVILAFVDKRYLYLGVGVEMASLLSYWAYYASNNALPYIPVYVIAVLLGLMIVVFVLQYIKGMLKNPLAKGSQM